MKEKKFLLELSDCYLYFNGMYFNGIITALATPFYQGDLDISSFQNLIRNQLDQGIDGVVVSGTTGESPNLTSHEVSQLIDVAKAEISNHLPVIVGVGHYSTQQAILNTQLSEKLKVDAVLAVVPYYNKPSQEGLKKHFTAIAKSTHLPIILYNVPSRTQTSLESSTIQELSQISNIVGIKEASGDMKFGKKLIEFLPSSFLITSGDDGSYLELAGLGGEGAISVASHLIPKPMKSFFKKMKSSSENQLNLLKEFHEKYDSLINLLFKVSNPMMIKQALYIKGLIRSAELRLPLVEPPEHLIKEIKQVLKELDYLHQ